MLIAKSKSNSEKSESAIQEQTIVPPKEQLIKNFSGILKTTLGVEDSSNPFGSQQSGVLRKNTLSSHLLKNIASY
jgi:hypothetical protein